MIEQKQPIRATWLSWPITKPFASVFGPLRHEPSTLLGVLFFLIATGFWVWRVPKGVDLSDEAFYVSLPLRLAVGDRPFLDERGSMQGAGLIEFPLVFVYRTLAGGTSGLVLFMRYAYLGFLTWIGIGLAGAVRGWISRGSALACGALVMFFVPYCIYQMSYNSLGGGLGMLAGILVLRLSRGDGLTTSSARGYTIFAGMAVAGAALAYPTLLPLAAIHAVTLLLFGRKTLGWWRSLLYYCVGGALVCTYVALFLLRSGFGAIWLTIDYVRAWEGELTGDLARALTQIERLRSDWFQCFVVAGAIAIVARRFKPVAFVLALYLPRLLLPSVIDENAASMKFFTCLALFAPFFALLVDDRRFAFRVMAILWAPGVFIGTVAGISSGNGGVATGLGAFSSAMAGVVLACRACEEALGRWRRVVGWLSIVAPIAVLSSFVKLASSEGAVYRDAHLRELTEKVRFGPFRGLRTTAAHRRLVEEMHTDISTNSKGSKYALFFPEMPSAYLSANKPGAIAETWNGEVPKRREINAAIFRRRASQVGIVGVRSCRLDFWRNCKASSILERKDHALVNAVNETHEVFLKRDEYWLLRPRGN